ncbi:MAG: hypothetical protein CENE_01178 [Candidatus Celerinatantimonas neptuna]|nr:MAG: hypothetical protein CENE_01178 [Candidatus Celerinatantimonas neptuna]
MNDKTNTQYENEFEQPIAKDTLNKFTTLQSFSPQPSTLIETTLADTLGLSMHNAIVNQQQSQMTTAASVTNACARLLQTQSITNTTTTDSEQIDVEDIEPQEPQPEPQKIKKKINLWRFLKGKPKKKKTTNQTKNEPSISDSQTGTDA